MPLTLEQAKYITGQPQPLESMNKQLMEIYKNREAAELGRETLAETKKYRTDTFEAALAKQNQTNLEKLQKKEEQSEEDKVASVISLGQGAMYQFVNDDPILASIWNDPGRVTGNYSPESLRKMQSPEVKKSMAKIMELRHPTRNTTLENYMREAFKANDMDPEDVKYIKKYPEMMLRTSVPEITKTFMNLRMVDKERERQGKNLKEKNAPAAPAPAAPAPAAPAPATPAPAAPMAPAPLTPAQRWPSDQYPSPESAAPEGNKNLLVSIMKDYPMKKGMNKKQYEAYIDGIIEKKYKEWLNEK